VPLARFLGTTSKNGKHDMNFRGILTTLALCLTFDARAALVHQYDFNGNLADTLGGPAPVIYQDGLLVGTVADTKGYADFAGRDANFFRDDRGLNEAAAGSVDFIRIYDNVLTQAQVYALMDPSKVPEPASGALMVMGLSLLGFSVGKGRRQKR
jgi:hypothetical protein